MLSVGCVQILLSSIKPLFFNCKLLLFLAFLKHAWKLKANEVILYCWKENFSKIYFSFFFYDSSGHKLHRISVFTVGAPLWYVKVNFTWTSDTTCGQWNENVMCLISCPDFFSLSSLLQCSFEANFEFQSSLWRHLGIGLWLILAK